MSPKMVNYFLPTTAAQVTASGGIPKVGKRYYA
jgi:hypothetical protein